MRMHLVAPLRHATPTLSLPPLWWNRGKGRGFLHIFRKLDGNLADSPRDPREGLSPLGGALGGGLCALLEVLCPKWC